MELDITCKLSEDNLHEMSCSIFREKMHTKNRYSFDLLEIGISVLFLTSALWVNGSHVNKIGKKIQFFLGYRTGKYGSSEWEISCLKQCSLEKNLQEMAFCNSISSLYGFFL